MDTKVCTRCRDELPATKEFFYRNWGTKDTFSPWCKECTRKYNLQHRHKKRMETYGEEYAKEVQDAIDARFRETEGFIEQERMEAEARIREIREREPLGPPKDPVDHSVLYGDVDPKVAADLASIVDQPEDDS